MAHKNNKPTKGKTDLQIKIGKVNKEINALGLASEWREYAMQLNPELNQNTLNLLVSGTYISGANVKVAIKLVVKAKAMIEKRKAEIKSL